MSGFLLHEKENLEGDNYDEIVNQVLLFYSTVFIVLKKVLAFHYASATMSL
jgi:hypothetical protein